MIRALVAFYSRTGVTRLIAHQLARRLGADLLHIRDVRPRDGMLGYMRSALEAMHVTLPEIAHSVIDPSDYELVVLGTPVWASHVSSPVRRFLHDHAGLLRPCRVLLHDGRKRRRGRLSRHARSHRQGCRSGLCAAGPRYPSGKAFGGSGRVRCETDPGAHIHGPPPEECRASKPCPYVKSAKTTTSTRLP